MSYSGLMIYRSGVLRPDLKATEPESKGMGGGEQCFVYVPDTDKDRKADENTCVFQYEHGLLLRVLEGKISFQLADKTPSYLTKINHRTIRCESFD